MTELIRRSWLREHAVIPIVAIYLLAAIVLGVVGARAGALLGGVVSPISSASAIAILSAIASGMMALTAIVFSLALVAIQFAGTAYSPRLGFLGRTPFFAHTLGLFTGTFVNALLAIRTVDLAGSPGINVSVVVIAMLWLLASIVVLVLFIPQLRGLLISDVLMTLYDRGAAAAVRVYEHAAPDVEAAIPAPPPNLPVTSIVRHVGRPSYLVGLDLPRLARYGVDAGAVVVISPAIGDAVVAGDRLAIVLGASRPLAEARLRDAFWLAPERSLLNDPAYAIRLIVDVAIRALSPAVNDPTTAVTALDELDGLLRLLAERQLEADQLADQHGVIRVIRAVPSWDDLVTLALTEIQQYGRDSFQVQRRLATLLSDLFELLPTHRRPVIERFARWRATSASKELLAAEAWAAASACDRQGLGHPQRSQRQ